MQHYRGQIVMLPERIAVCLVDRTDSSSWQAVVVYSEDTSYPVGGYNICCPDEGLAKGTMIDIEEFLKAK